MNYLKKGTMALLIALCSIMASCNNTPRSVVTSPIPETTFSQSVPSVAKTQPIQDELTWLYSVIDDGAIGPELDSIEIANLNELADITFLLPCFIKSTELNKGDMLNVLYAYYQDAMRYNYNDDMYEIKAEIKYPLEGLHSEGYTETPYVSPERANRIVKDVLDLDIPEKEMDYGEYWETNVWVADNTYYVALADLWPHVHSLVEYQYIGDDMYYLVFSGDNSHWPGPDDFEGETIQDFCRMVVKRSASAWGFTIVSKLKYWRETILPNDFPLPKYKMEK